MLPGTARAVKWLPAHLVAKRTVLSNILIKSLHAEAITGCNTIFVWQRQDYMLETVHYVSHLLAGVGSDDIVDAAEKFVCLMYGKGNGSKSIDNSMA